MYGEYLGEGSGVASFEAPVGDVAHLEGESGAKGVEEGTFAHAAVAGEEDGLAGDKLLHLVEPRTFEGRNLINGVSCGGIDALHLVVYLPKLFVVKVHLVEEDAGGDVVGLSGDQQAVDETRGGAWEAEGGHDAQQIDVGGDDVRLLGELGGAADDVVLAVGDIVDDAGAVVLQLEEDMVAHGHGVCLLVAPQAIVTAQPAVDGGLRSITSH